MKLLFMILTMAVSLSVFAKSEEATIVMHNGYIWTATGNNAEAIAIKDNKILVLGSNKEIKAYIGSNTKVIDLNGKLVTPGLIDNHTHFSDVADLLTAVQLRSVSTKQEFSARIGDFAKTMDKGQWMTGGIWDHEAWGGDLPEAIWVDEVTPDTPIYLARTDGHMAFVNSAAMKIAGINKNTADVAGGEIVRDRDGNPTGVLKDEAMSLVYNKIPQPSLKSKIKSFKAGVDHALSMGVTQIHDMGKWSDFDAFAAMAEMKQLKMRVYSFVPLQTHQRLAAYVKTNGRGDDMHRWGGLKAMVDGSLGSTTAWFYQPYNDQPDSFGFPIYDLTEFRSWIEGGDAAGLNVTIHAIGDRANDWLLDQFEEVSAKNPENMQRRWRIEHAQHLTPKAVKRMAKMGVIPSMQPYHAIDDGRWAEKRIGERIHQTYVFKSLMDAGAVVTFGSDAPVAPMNVMKGIYGAVTRQTIDGANPDGWVPEQKITVEQALKAYTVNNAYAGFQEDRLGKLQPGYLADLVVLEQNIFTIKPAEIKDVVVALTMVDGKIVYKM